MDVKIAMQNGGIRIVILKALSAPMTMACNGDRVKASV
jgi:hypothetical protein